LEIGTGIYEEGCTHEARRGGRVRREEGGNK
jgi:hypothetical protein